MSKKIDFMIVGMQKAGTTSLMRNLEMHPSVASHPQMEMTFFYDDDEYNIGWPEIYSRYFNEGSNDKKHLAKHATLVRSERAIERLWNHNNKIRVIFCLRNPVHRAYSSFLMEKANGIENDLGLSDAISKTSRSGTIDPSDWRQNIYIGLGVYINFIEKLEKIIPRDQIKYVILESFEHNTVLEFLDLSKVNDIQNESIYNSATKARYSSLIPIMNAFLSEKNPFKKMIKNAVGHQNSSILGEKLRALNKTKANFVYPDYLESLYDFYFPYNLRLEERLKLDLSIWNKR